MGNYLQHVSLFFRRIIFLLLLYTLSRFFFYLLNTSYFQDLKVLELIRLFVIGIRFDLAAIAFTNIIFILFLLPGGFKNNPGVQRWVSIAFFVINALAILANFIDAKFFDFINKRSTSSIFSLLGANRDVWLLIPQFLKDYWYVALSWIVLMVAAWRWMPRLNIEKLIKTRISPGSAAFQSLIFLGITGFLLWAGRGISLKPIGIVNAARYTGLQYVPLVLNTPFSIIKTLENRNLAELRFFSEDSLKAIYNPIHRNISEEELNPRNVVVIILESFSKEYIGFLNDGRGYTPCLDSILGSSLVFTQAFANGTQSYEAMPAIIAGIPSLLDEPYSGSNYADNYIESIPRLLNREGYHTSFFHGGNNGTMGFDNFARVEGIGKYYGREEYGNEDDYDGNWGIWDEPFLQYFASELNTFPEPFFSAVFTLSSHHPYKIPQQYNGIFREGSLPILKSISYADHALGKFFETASGMPWFNNTLFIITADHAAQAVERIFNTPTGMFAIPLAFHCPGDTLMHGRSNMVAQQTDILPTVLHYLNYANPFFAFGTNLMDTVAQHSAVSFINGNYQLIEGDYVLVFNGMENVAFYNHTLQLQNEAVKPVSAFNDPAEREILARMEAHIKAIIQTYNYSLINNRLTAD
jgi:phosphoglycerol transferase MdoB-like AlkP superfamily enzyme